jgi:hypothetical protein
MVWGWVSTTASLVEPPQLTQLSQGQLLNPRADADFNPWADVEVVFPAVFPGRGIDRPTAVLLSQNAATIPVIVAPSSINPSARRDIETSYEQPPMDCSNLAKQRAAYSYCKSLQVRDLIPVIGCSEYSQSFTKMTVPLRIGEVM